MLNGERYSWYSMCPQRFEACVDKLHTEGDSNDYCRSMQSGRVLAGPRSRVTKGTETSTLCEKLKGPDFLSDAKLQDLLQDVLPLGIVHDAHSFQLPVC